MEKLMMVVAVLIMIGGGALAVNIWTLGDDESDYEIICIGGHEYYRANFMQKGFLGIRLHDDGRPVKCN